MNLPSEHFVLAEAHVQAAVRGEATLNKMWRHKELTSTHLPAAVCRFR